MENLGIFVGLEDVGEVLAVGVGDEDLTEIIALYHLYDSFDAFTIQSIKYVIEQQDRLVAIYHFVIYHF